MTSLAFNVETFQILQPQNPSKAKYHGEDRGSYRRCDAALVPIGSMAGSHCCICEIPMSKRIEVTVLIDFRLSMKGYSHIQYPQIQWLIIIFPSENWQGLIKTNRRIVSTSIRQKIRSYLLVVLAVEFPILYPPGNF